MTSVAFVSPAHGRFAVTALVLAQRRRLIRELAGRGIDAVSIIVACDENLTVAAEYGCQTVEAANLPLGTKCNIGLRRAAELAEYVVWVGSDNWIHPDVFQPLIEMRGNGHAAVFSGKRLVIVDLGSGRLQRIAYPSKYGAIPWVIDGRLLRTKARPDTPIKPNLRRGLDGALMRGLRRTRQPFEIVLDDLHDFRCVDFKTAESITPYDGLAKNLSTAAEEPAWEALSGWFPADLVTRARELSERTN